MRQSNINYSYARVALLSISTYISVYPYPDLYLAWQIQLAFKVASIQTSIYHARHGQRLSLAQFRLLAHITFCLAYLSHFSAPRLFAPIPLFLGPIFRTLAKFGQWLIGAPGSWLGLRLRATIWELRPQKLQISQWARNLRFHSAIWRFAICHKKCIFIFAKGSTFCDFI